MAKESLFRRVTRAGEIEVREKVPELKRVPADKPVHGPILSEGIFEIPLHWTGAQRKRCYEATGFCNHCESKSPRADTFLLAVWDKNERRAFWIELTDHSADALATLLEGANLPYYGTVVKIERERKTMKAPITVELDRWATVHTRLPSAMTPDDTIIRIFESEKSAVKRRKKAVS